MKARWRYLCCSLSSSHTPPHSCCIPGSMWNTIWKDLGKFMGRCSSVWVQNCSSTVAMDKGLLWFLCTKEHSGAGFGRLHRLCALCVPVGHLEPWDPASSVDQCYSAADSATVESPYPLLHTSHTPMSAQVQRRCTDFQVWNRLESCVLVWSLQWY